MHTPCMSLGSVVLVTKYEVDMAKHVRIRAQISQPNQNGTQTHTEGICYHKIPHGFLSQGDKN